MTDVGARILQSVQMLRNRIGDGGVFPNLKADRERIERALEQLESGCESADRPLRILLAGGTGVGKSSLLNALAGSSIADAGARRPTTRTFTAYMHASDRDDWLDMLGHVHIVRHSRDELRGKAIIDAPDADSATLENRKQLERALEHTDLVLMVVTSEKYVSEAVLTLLDRYRIGRHFAYVFNKMDAGVDGTLIEDFYREAQKREFPAGPVFGISARAMIERADPEETGELTREFRNLEAFIGQQLTRVRIEEIKRINLDQRAAQLADHIESLLPEEFESVPARWRAICDEATASFHHDIEQIAAETILRRDRVARLVTRARLSRFRGLFGIFSAIVLFLRSLSEYRIPGLQSSAPLSPVSPEFPLQHAGLLGQKFEQLIQTWRLSAHRTGMDVDAFLHFPDSAPPIDPEWIRLRVSKHLDQELTGYSRRAGFLTNLLSNLVPYGWIGYWMYAIVEAVIARTVPPWSSLSGAAIVLIALLSLQWVLVDRLLSLFSYASAGRILRSVFRTMRHDFDMAFEGAFTETTSELNACVDSLRQSIDGLRTQSE